MRDRLLLAALKAVPAPLAEHVLFLLRSNPELPDRWKHHIRPIHYYEPLPDFRGITAEAARRRRVSASVAFDVEGQRQQVRRLGDAYRAEIEALASSRAFDFCESILRRLRRAAYYAIVRDAGRRA
jgi:hypothetical protein